MVDQGICELRGTQHLYTIARVYLCMLSAPRPGSRINRSRANARDTLLVCQSRLIDEPDADIATNLRNIVREQLAAGKSVATIRDYLMARYGDFVLLKPPFKPETALLWIGPFALAAISFAAGFAVLHIDGTIAPDSVTPDLSWFKRSRSDQSVRIRRWKIAHRWPFGTKSLPLCGCRYLGKE
jgi:Cytochrome C biogenesis protein